MADKYAPRLEQGATHMLTDIKESVAWPVINESVRTRAAVATAASRRCVRDAHASADDA